MRSPNGGRPLGGGGTIDGLAIEAEDLDDGAVVLRCRGRLTAEEHRAFVEAVTSKASPGGRLRVDLTGIAAVDGDGIRAIVEAVGQAQVEGAAVDLYASPAVRDTAAREGLGAAIGL